MAATFPRWNKHWACLGTLRPQWLGKFVAILGPDRIVGGSSDNTIKIWNTDGECLKTLKATVVG